MANSMDREGLFMLMELLSRLIGLKELNTMKEKYDFLYNLNTISFI